MTNPIGPIGIPRIPIPPEALSGAEAKSSPTGAVDFQGLLMQSIGETNALGLSAQAAIEQSLTGGDITQVEVISSVKKADLALKMMLQIRNKLHEAYEEIQQLRM